MNTENQKTIRLNKAEMGIRYSSKRSGVIGNKQGNGR